MGEYIERKAAIEALLDVYEREFPTADGAFDLFATRIAPRTLRNVPAADVAPVRHGRWIEARTLEKCSCCGKKGFPDWRYCPNCGARMD